MSTIDNDDSSEPIDAMEEQEQFIREFIATYKEHPVLWDSSNSNYRNRCVRREAYTKLIEKCRQYIPDADEGFVKTKIDSMRSSFRREYYKLKSIKGHKPTLWYFSLLSFLAGDDDKIAKASIIKVEPLKESCVKLGFWTREYSAILIDIFKKYKCIYMPTYTAHRFKAKRDQAIKKITEELMTKTKRKFKEVDVRRKIQMLRGQFRTEFCKVKASEERGDRPVYKPSLWCYHMLKFLSDVVVVSRKTRRSSSVSDDNSADERPDCKMEIVDDDNQDRDTEEDSDSENKKVVANNANSLTKNWSEDIYETIAKNVAHKMRDMTESQRNIAQRILNDLMYYGQMEELTAKSRLSLDGK